MASTGLEKVGFVDVNADGTVEGSGFAYEAYKAIAARAAAAHPLPDPSTPPKKWTAPADDWRAKVLPHVVARRKSWAASALASADVLVPMLAALDDRLAACEAAISRLHMLGGGRK